MIVPVDELTDRDPALIEYVVVHHSVAPQDTDIESLARMEEAAQGFTTIGYNCYLKKTDTGWVIQEGRPLDKLPAAQYGLNEEGYAICVGGNYEPGVAGVPTDAIDHASLYLIIQRIIAIREKCPNLKYVIGHRDVATIKAKHGGNPADFSTACPGDLLYAHLHNIRVATCLKSPPELL